MWFDDKSKKKIGRQLAVARETSGFTQKEIANSLGHKSSQYVSNWERGVSPPPRQELENLARLYGLSKTDLVDLFSNELRNSLNRLFRSK